MKTKRPTYEVTTDHDKGQGFKALDMTAPEPARMAEWGHWGILFFWKRPDDYAPTKIEGTLPFPVGAAGPVDGFLGSPERERYKAAIKAWTEDGTLPAGLQARA